MSVMNSVYYDDGIVEVVDAEEIASDEFIVKVCLFRPSLADIRM